MLCCSGATPATGAGKLLQFKSSAAQFEPSRQHRLNVGSKAPEILDILCKYKCKGKGKGKAIIGPVTRTLKRKTETAKRCKTSDCYNIMIQI
jgi:hypothetical protein